MTQEEKQLLLADLSARLPYGVKVQHQHQDYLDEIQTIEHIARKYGEIETESVLGFVDDFKPYLRPMSSMTEEEFAEYEKANDLDTLDSSETLRENMKAKHRVRISKWYHGTDWLNAHHFDYRGLIERGLAIAVTEENNPYDN